MIARKGLDAVPEKESARLAQEGLSEGLRVKESFAAGREGLGPAQGIRGFTCHLA